MALSQPQAISGLGGIGKTQVALEYAYRYRNDYQAVLWVKASTQEELAEEVAALARILNLPEQRFREQQEIISAVKQWLAKHAGWLLIFDNADDISPLAEYLPPEPKGHILLTTRAHAMGGMAQKIEVTPMDEAEGVHLLLHRAGLIEQKTTMENIAGEMYQQATAIFHLLGGLPLALDQAGAYIEETHESLSNYISLYQQQRKDLLERRGGICSDHLPVATTWALAFQTIEQSNPAAIELMRLCAFLAPDAIPEEMIFEGDEYLSPLLQSITVDRSLWNNTLVDLLKYSLIQRNQATMSLSIHRLLQAVIKDEMDAQQQEGWEICVVRVMEYVFPVSVDKDNDNEGRYAPWIQNQAYLPHALQATEYVTNRLMTFSEAVDLLDSVGEHLYDHGQYNQAEPLLQRSLSLHERISGLDYPDILVSLDRLADLYETQAKYKQAERLYQRSLTICEQALGPNHSYTVDSLNNLASLYKRLDKYEQAEKLFQRALAIREHELGPDHPDTARSLINLAALYDDQYEFDQAKPLHKRSLAIYERAFGPDHPNTAKALRSFADLYHGDGRYRRAHWLYRRALAIQERVLGPEHPDVAKTLDSLVFFYMMRRKYDRAEECCQRALAIQERVLGPEHPDIAYDLDKLAFLYKCLRKYEQAEALYQRVLTILERTLDPEHPYTALVCQTFADLYADQGKYEQAEALYLRALSIQERALDPNHPDTVSVRKAYKKLQRKKNRRRGGLFSFFFRKRR